MHWVPSTNESIEELVEHDRCRLAACAKFSGNFTSSGCANKSSSLFSLRYCPHWQAILSIVSIGQEAFSIFVFLLVVISAMGFSMTNFNTNNANGPTDASSYHQLVITFIPLVSLMIVSYVRMKIALRQIMFYEMFRIGAIPLFDVPKVVIAWLPRTWQAIVIVISFCYAGGVIGYYATKGLIAGVGAVAVIKIVADCKTFVVYLKSQCYGFTDSMLSLSQLVRSMIVVIHCQ